MNSVNVITTCSWDLLSHSIFVILNVNWNVNLYQQTYLGVDFGKHIILYLNL